MASNSALMARNSALRRLARQEAIKAIRGYIGGVLVAFLILAGGGGYGVYSSDINQTHQLRAAAQGSCQRVNVLRAQSNLSDSVSFVILAQAGIREAALAQQGGKNAQLHAQSAMTFRAQVGRLRITAITDCNQAVDHPLTYRTPAAGPLGNPYTGQLNPHVSGILKQSAALVRHDNP